MSFQAELQPGIILFTGILTSRINPGGSLKVIRQIRSKGFLVIKTQDPPLLFSFQITVHFFELNSIGAKSGSFEHI